MKVFITGATGFVGSQTTLALLKAGHQVKLLARSPDKAQQYFTGHGYGDIEIVQGDMVDKQFLRQTISGSDAVLHAAAMVSLDKKSQQQMHETNQAGMEAVVGSAAELGIANILYVSSLAALFSPKLDTINEDTPLNDATSAYASSKRDCDRIIRQLQERGAPIQISYPSGVIGPDDPGLSESNKALKMFVKTLVLNTASGISLVDGRDVAKAHLHLLENPPADPTSARFMIAGHFNTWAEFHALLEKASGKPIPAPKVPGAMLRGFGKVVDFAQRFNLLNSSPLTGESASIVTQMVAPDSNKICRAANMAFRPMEETLSDTLNWLEETGQLRLGASVNSAPIEKSRR